MFFHVYLVEAGTYGRAGRTRSHHFLNLTQQELRARIVAPWDGGRAMTYDGRTVDPTGVNVIRIFRSEDRIVSDRPSVELLTQDAVEVTNRWITGEPGRLVPRPPTDHRAVAPLNRPIPRRAVIIVGTAFTAAVALISVVAGFGGSLPWLLAAGAVGIGAALVLGLSGKSPTLSDVLAIVLLAAVATLAVPLYQVSRDRSAALRQVNELTKELHHGPTTYDFVVEHGEADPDGLDFSPYRFAYERVDADDTSAVGVDGRVAVGTKVQVVCVTHDLDGRLWYRLDNTFFLSQDVAGQSPYSGQRYPPQCPTR